MLRKMMLTIAGITVLITILPGCASIAEQPEPPQLHKISVQRIETRLKNQEIPAAMEDFFKLQNSTDNHNDEVQLDLVEAHISTALNDAMQNALDSSDFTEAIKLFISADQADWKQVFENISYEDSGPISLDGLMRDRFNWYINNGQPIRALAYIRQLKNFSSLTDDDLILLLNTSLEEQQYTVAKQLIAALRSRNVPIETELPPESVYRYSQAELLGGTVTIWVNRGMKIEAGVGLPDRVIGSGFYVDRRGYIITNYHVIQSQVDPEYEGYSRLFVRPSENPDVKIPARVIGWDTVFDIALLKVETESETIFSFSTAEVQEPGERIYAIGSPAGLENTITSGIVSATDRRFLQMGNVIQVDVPINQGNSGGPLLDEDGNLIGVVFAGIEQFEGINFAIPVRWLIHIFPDLYDQGAVKHPFLGIALQENDKNVEVTYVLPGSPADRIGLTAGDILVALADRKISDMVEAHDAILNFAAGTLLKISWTDKQNLEREECTVLDERPRIPLEKAIQYDQAEKLFAPAFGMQVEKFQDNILGTKYIVKKVYRGSIADETGMSVNDPFSLQQWKYLNKEKVLIAQVRIKKRKAGFLETGVQLGTYTETTNFL